MDEGAEEIFSIDMCVFSVCGVCVCVGGGVGGVGGAWPNAVFEIFHTFLGGGRQSEKFIKF